MQDLPRTACACGLIILMWRVDLLFGSFAFLAEFAVLGALLRNAVSLYNPLPGVTPAMCVLTLGACYGALDELHQSLVPGRSMQLSDWLADAVGVALGSYALDRWQR